MFVITTEDEYDTAVVCVTHDNEKAEEYVSKQEAIFETMKYKRDIIFWPKYHKWMAKNPAPIMHGMTIEVFEHKYSEHKYAMEKFQEDWCRVNLTTEEHAMFNMANNVYWTISEVPELP